MEKFDLDNIYATDYRPARKIPFLLISACVTFAVFLYAYSSGFLPHYTFIFDDGTVTVVRDDAKYLAEQAALEAAASRQIYRINGVEVSREEYESVLRAQQRHQQQIADAAAAIDAQQAQLSVQVQSNQQVAVNQPDYANGQTRKCIDGQGKVVYQTDTCASKGYKTEKMIGAMDGAVSQAQTYSYSQAEQRAESQKTYQVDGRSVSKAEFDAVVERNKRIDAENHQAKVAMCKSLEERREYIRSQQRHNSTQYWRDQYTSVSKEWQDKCLGSQGMS